MNGDILESRRCLAVLEEEGLPRSMVHMAGGGAGVTGFDRDLADATRRSVSVSQDSGASPSAVGAAQLAALSIGGRGIEGVSGRAGNADEAVTEPDEAAAARWDQLFARHDLALAVTRQFFEDDARHRCGSHVSPGEHDKEVPQ